MGNDNTALTLSVERIMNQSNLTTCYFQVHSYYDYIYLIVFRFNTIFYTKILNNLLYFSVAGKKTMNIFLYHLAYTQIFLTST